MDTVQEENSLSSSLSPIVENDAFSLPASPQLPTLQSTGSQVYQSSTAPQVSQIINDFMNSSNRAAPEQMTDSTNNSRSNSRRASVIIQALRRPSQAVALSAAQIVMSQRRYILGLFNDSSDLSKKEDMENKELQKLKHNRKIGEDALSIILSALYAKLIVVLGIAFPTLEVITNAKTFFYQGFYLYLYIGSILFVVYMYATLLKEKALVEMINNYNRGKSGVLQKTSRVAPKYGSFYLRLGAIAFGIGSMVYSGLEFGRYFELKNNLECNSNILHAITPVTRMVLTLVQVQFIFLNSKNIDFNDHKTIARFGIMHMIATNLSEWLYVLVAETKHEIIHLSENRHAVETVDKFCQDGLIMGSLVANASPFLFPCTIEYSLICAVILFEMWKKIKMEPKHKNVEKDKNVRFQPEQNKVMTHFQFDQFGGKVINPNHHFTIDCSNAHKGLFAGILVIVLTIISLIMFFVLTNTKRQNEKVAIFEVNVVELSLYVVTTLAVIVAMIKMRHFKYDRKNGQEGNSSGIGLDCILLVVAQTGMFIYCVFSVIGCCFTYDANNEIEVAVEIFSFIQTCIQTIFILDAWWRRCRNIEQFKCKPGKEIITFLIVANMAMWAINTLEKNRAEFRPSHLDFFGDWAWTIITHISMPLAIFYRFHSTICLFEIWKTVYKIKTKYDTNSVPLM
ncbi:proton channel OtopLc-like isoform X1 [Diorhabda sublineata]|uniref:proton channel OtopLc-like isoform X1 n=1 Tax=Diorhabda sublineata TaxID=1163346 RepID=UPI0024E04795|nr:proton channel OtopLc-like isoform X1 [Diorhabda sublineata]